MDFAGKNVLVIGAAKSGAAAAMLLLGEEACVTINDQIDTESLGRELGELAHHPRLRLAGGGHPASLVNEETSLVVKNPGIPYELPPLVQAQSMGIPVITEVELAYNKLNALLVGITGTNGKTTTTALTGAIYRDAGRITVVAGNIGLPLTSVVVENMPRDAVVAELSSFQLEGTIHFRPRISVILNITPDHLDRHGSMAAYREAKARIFANQGEGDAAIFNADDPEAYALSCRPQCPVYLFSRKQEVDRGAFLRGDVLVLRDDLREETLCRTGELAMPGAHNVENALAAALMAWLGGVPADVITRTLTGFAGVEHRLEFVRTLDGVDYINDSKGTNTDAAIKALEAFAEKKVLIAGGYDKGADFEGFSAVVKEHARHVVLLGQTADKLADALAAAGMHSYSFAKTLEDAVRQAKEAAMPGDLVLLSPACASWDMFRSFEVRGDRFKEAVWALGGQKIGREKQPDH